MCDTKEEVDEEVKRQDVCLEQLAEPLLIILSPPPPFLPVPGKPTMFWPKWHKAFENYLEGLGENALVDSTKCVLLQNCLGPEGQQIFTTLIQRGTTYAAAISVLTSFFSVDLDSQMCRLKFHQRAQMPGETVDQFVSALEELLKPCNYGDLKDKLILDQLIMKTNSPHLKERLLLEKGGVTLAAAMLIAKEVESGLNESELFGFHEVSVDIGDDVVPPVQKKTKRGRPRRGEIRVKAKPLLIKNTSKSKIKDNYYYSNDKQYYSDAGGNCRGAAENNLACDKTSDEGDKGDTEASSSSQTMEEEMCNEAQNDDKDFVISSSKLKGPSCPICVSRRFRDANKLARHMRMHTKEKPFICPVCAVTFSQSYHMTRHLRNQHGAGQHICPTCGKSLGNSAELRTHKRVHKSQTLSSPDCQEKFTDDEALSNHIKSHDLKETTETEEQGSKHGDEVENEAIEMDINENNDSNDDDADNEANSDNGDSQDTEHEVNIKMEKNDSDEAKSQDGGNKKEKVPSKTKTKGHFCPICVGRRFRGANKLARHMRTHTKEKPFNCPVCALTFSQSYHMTRHLRNQHGLGKYICTKCGKILNTWQELKTHRKTHIAEDFTCHSCNKQFKEKVAYLIHRKSHKKSAPPLSHICGECGKVFGRMYHLKRHIVTHRKADDGETYSCPDCQKNFAFQADLNKHRESHAKENTGTCPKCNEAFESPEELETHMEIHEKSYPCNTCGKRFKVEYALKKHEQSHQSEQYYCSLCQKHFIKLSHYKRHILVHDRRESRCPHCDSVFLQLTALKYHLRTHTTERPFQCSCCMETFEVQEDLEQHRLKHRKFRKERPYSCTRCDNAFSTLVELTEHMNVHEGEQPSNCPICGKTFLNKNKLEKHLSIHTGERPHLCSICGNGFPSAASLKLHVHIHTGEKPFHCSECNKTFSSSSGLRLHSRQHMDVRPSYECPECGRTYGRMTELKMHQRYHTGDKPYACTCCSKRFISKDKLNVHMRIHTGERPYSCPHCGQTFTQTGDRNRHISKYHAIDVVTELQ
ncbi:zinc finger protein 585A-like [Solea senegalensis]|uniref:Zinc finger protein 585A-like n=1 Tax=Solea senegalensis TaxID=28829 RepID=A0AAV6QAE4_SOLSE|nr:zinc finger protein 665-like [Solea senegalensis]KAG7486534.1 zinc finger protein 585A-like [Solea senegalensis]